MAKFGRIIQSILRFMLLGCIAYCLLSVIQEAKTFDREGGFEETVFANGGKLEYQFGLEGKLGSLTKVPYPRQHARISRDSA